MLAILAATLFTAGQYTTQISISIARTTAIAPPLPINEHSKFAVSLMNGTKNPVNILSQECRKGYDSLSFELMDPKGKTFFIKRKPKKGLSKDLLPQTIESVGMVVHHLDFGDQTWTAPPAGIAGKSTGWKIRAKFTIPKDKASEEKNLWTGTIMSGWSEATGTE